LYYDRHGNLIEFNPEDFIIEEIVDEADGPNDVNVTLQPATPSKVGSERPRSSFSRPKSAVSYKGGRRLAARRIKKVTKESE
jgi:hypothetical protein